MKITTRLIATAALLACTAAASAQSAAPPETRNVVQLAATGTVEVQQDLLVVTLSANKEGSDAAAVQTQLKQALDAALTEAKRSAQPGQLDLRTGPFGLYPRYGKDGKVNGWQGRAELVMEGRDFSRITTTAGKIQSMAISQVAFALSREARAKVETDAQTQAIEQFKSRAAELTKGFGFANYGLREVAVNSNEMSPGPRPRMMAMEAKASSFSDSAVPVEAGKAQVVVTVSGSVQMR
ncbi:putative secreted protein [Acidovorax sp. 69]|uniref:SIMPL domain-containing protein n=1 Tax=Acidovorax sp. 69 TaxID=2035202 RepID=UPI000C231724|nr:SIMPL domain-containing protein [Acidovorax sp. 69]PJI98162.1 putative secreted protein [Acidovorax sp. 69]